MIKHEPWSVKTVDMSAARLDLKNQHKIHVLILPVTCFTLITLITLIIFHLALSQEPSNTSGVKTIRADCLMGARSREQWCGFKAVPLHVPLINLHEMKNPRTWTTSWRNPGLKPRASVSYSRHGGISLRWDELSWERFWLVIKVLNTFYSTRSTDLHQTIM